MGAAAYPTHIPAPPRPFHVSTALVDAGDGFETIRGKPRNFGGELTRIALANPTFMLKLARGPS